MSKRSLNLALLYSRIRVEEKLLIDALRKRGVPVEPIDIRSIAFNPTGRGPFDPFDVVLDRCIAHGQALAIVQLLEATGVRCVNRGDVTRRCGSKLETSLALLANEIPTLPIRIATSPEAALQAIEELGYPVVLKPIVGSWGRLLAKVNDRDAAEAILEHKATLGSVQHQTFYIQPFVEKCSFDIRSFVIDGETICAVRRHSEHWITNTARGAKTDNCPVSDRLAELSCRSAEAVGGGMLAVDLFETADGELIVNEVNSTMEFRNSIDITGVNIPDRMVDYLFDIVDRSEDGCGQEWVIEGQAGTQPKGGTTNDAGQPPEGGTTNDAGLPPKGRTTNWGGEATGR